MIDYLIRVKLKFPKLTLRALLTFCGVLVPIGSMDQLFIETPLLESEYLSSCVSPYKVFLKLENCQPCNSFKIRGISKLCAKAVSEGFKGFVTFSGGNTGIALAYVASKMNLPSHICVPNFVSRRILERIKKYGAQIHMATTARESYDLAVNLANSMPSIAFVHPYADPITWEGYSKMVEETKEQLKGVKPSCFVVSVGGGGLLMGILTGLEKVGWTDVPVVAMETIGADSLNKTLKAGQIVENYLTSIAKTLGAPSVTPTLLEVLPRFNVISATLTDLAAVQACLNFADHHAFLVEPACGVSLAVVYEKILPELLEDNGIVFDKSRSGPIVIIVCGGSDTSVEIISDFALQVGLPLPVHV